MKYAVTLEQLRATEEGRKFLTQPITLTPEEEKIWYKIQAQEQSLLQFNQAICLSTKE